jgi:hypothetical protein
MAFGAAVRLTLARGDGAVLISPLGQVVLFDNGGFFICNDAKTTTLRL